MNEDEVKDKCQTCHLNDALDLHKCPYHQDVNEDEEYKCNCCDECISECCQSI